MTFPFGGGLGFGGLIDSAGSLAASLRTAGELARLSLSDLVANG